MRLGPIALALLLAPAVHAEELAAQTPVTADAFPAGAAPASTWGGAQGWAIVTLPGYRAGTRADALAHGFALETSLRRRGLLLGTVVGFTRGPRLSEDLDFGVHAGAIVPFGPSWNFAAAGVVGFASSRFRPFAGARLGVECARPGWLLDTFAVGVDLRTAVYARSAADETIGRTIALITMSVGMLVSSR